MKRKADNDVESELVQDTKRRAIDHRERFREGLFDSNVLKDYSDKYNSSQP